MNWKILGISETKDKKAITRAYRDKLTSVNPEEKPEEFKALREAYDTALRLADEDETKADKDEFDLWVDKLGEIYKDFSKRIDVEAWKTLLSEDICKGLDSRGEIEKRLLLFLSENYRIPQRVWIYLNDEFDFLNRIDELYEEYPKDYIDFAVISGIKYKEALPVEMFTPGKDGSAIDEYYSFFYEARNRGFVEGKEYLDKIIELPEAHPYGQMYLLQAALFNEKADTLDEIASLYKSFKDDQYMQVNYANTLFTLEKYNEAEACCKEIIDSTEDSIGVKNILLETLIKLEKLEEASDLIDTLMFDAGGDQRRVMELSIKRNEIAEALVEEYRQKLKANPNDEEVKLHIAWYLTVLERNEEAKEAFLQVNESAADPFFFNNMASGFAMDEKDYAKAKEYTLKLVDIIDKLELDGTEKTARRKKRRSEMLTRIALCCYELKELDEALATLEKAINEADDRNQTLAQAISLLIHMEQYDYARSYAKEFVEKEPYLGFSNFMMAYVCYEVGDDGNAFEYINTAIEVEPSSLEYYLYKMRILARNGVYDQLLECVEYLEENGVEGVLELDYFKAQALKGQTEDLETIRDAYMEIEQALDDQQEDPGFTADFYYDFASLLVDLQREKDSFVPKDIFDVIEKGLAADEKHLRLLEYKAWMYRVVEEFDESIALYESLKNRPLHSLGVEQGLANMYFTNKYDPAKALENYKVLFENNSDDVVTCYYIAMCYLALDDHSNAEKFFKLEMELDPNDSDAYFRLAETYMDQKLYDESLVQIDKAIEIINELDGNWSHIYELKIKILRRMERYNEALDVIRVSAEKYHEDYEDEIQEIYALMGDKARLETRLSATKISDYNQLYRLVKYYLVNGQISKAKFTVLSNMLMLNKSQKLSVNNLISIFECDFEKSRKLAKKLISMSDDVGYNLFFRVAADCLFLHDMDECRKYAKLAYEDALKYRSETGRNNLLLLSDRVWYYSFLGEKEKAMEAIAAVEGKRLCANCVYGSCMDLDIYKIYFEICFGTHESAFAMAKAAKERWPQDDDVAYLYNWLEKTRYDGCYLA